VEIEGAKGKTYSFKGLEELKNYLDYNVFNNLEFADFDTTDAQLVPSAGACTLCPKRTKNAGGLFDDIVKKDNCLDGGCFRAKQVAAYKQRLHDAKVGFVGAEVVFKSRGGSLDNQLSKELSKTAKVIKSYEGREITKKELEESLKLIDKGKTPNVKVAILVGRTWTAKDMKKKVEYLSFDWSEPQKQTSSGSGSPALSEKEREKQKIERAIVNKEYDLNQYETANAIAKKFGSKAITDSLLQKVIFTVITESSIDNSNIIAAFVALGLKFKVEKHGESKPVEIDGPIDNVDEYTMDGEEIERVIGTLKGKKLHVMAAVAVHGNLYGEDSVRFLKENGIDAKEIAKKAKADAIAWLKQEQAKKKEQPAPSKTKKKGGKNG
jgi:hypothetical protein